MKLLTGIVSRMAITGALLAGAARPAVADVATNVACVADTTLQKDFPDNNTGGAETFTAGGRNQGGPTCALMQFDVAGVIPAGATINSAALTLTVVAVNGPASTFALHRVLAAWGEGVGTDFQGNSPGGENDATWNVRLGPENPWATPGGDFDPAASATKDVSGTGDYTFDSTTLAADVQAWLDHPGTNFGWLLRSELEATQGSIRRFAGRLSTANPPQLIVDYSPPPPPASAPVLFDAALTGNQIRFSFEAGSNRAYTVEFRDVLGTNSWTTLTNLSAQPEAMTVHITNAISSDERYFRVRTP